MSDPPALPSRLHSRHPRLRSAVIAVAAGATLFVVGAIGLAPTSAPSGASSVPGGRSGAGTTAEGGIEALRERLRRLPEDHDGWAGLGMAYVQQARTTADPATYAKAEQALRKSMALQSGGNYPAQVGMGALAAARHQFTAALEWGTKAAATNPHGVAAQGVLADAYTQLGQYQAAFTAVQRMTDLRPDSASLARASYTWELRGDPRQARSLMERALTAAATPADAAFAQAHLAILALESGDAAGALGEAEKGLKVLPQEAPLLEARARAHTALGDTRQAIADYTRAIAIAPLPQYLLGLGELQQSLGHTGKARAQFRLLAAQQQLLEAGGAVPDTDAILYEADHGSPDRALALARPAVRSRPFLAVQDAYAWALHRTGNDTDALEAADKALALGTRSALFHYHRAMIRQSLGDTKAARQDLTRALAIDPHFHPLHAPDARAALERIDHTR
ncbi:tetratricopeptide repeat protein [Streptomyces sp. H27-C3]|uniref:tetratricopeptide repeat protein n=1 Tax=Streptomyces sp. H27-C3 TaxID=3046305 RepID=UPI0024B9E8B6|nr:tetratricopeptide repeat protein [Streptomyces sp. H27-C3]MDJ0463842.1 tetratricopeptide repeat protein [Streptomyces sp. H27-C3]